MTMGRVRSRAAGEDGLIIDRTSSMTVAQVEKFWRAATAELLARVAESSHLQPGLSNLASRAREGDLLEEIADRALRQVFER